MGIDELVLEQQERWRPFSKAFADATGPAADSWRQHVEALVERREKQRKETRSHEKSGMQPFIERLAGEERLRAGLELFERGAHGLAVEYDAAPGPGQRLLDGDLAINIFAGAVEASIDGFGLPYAGQSSETRNGPHPTQTASATAATGAFGFAHNIGNEGGSSYCAAALWVHFMRRSPGHPPGQGNPGLAQVRPYVPYDYLWAVKSYLATAHNRGVFGVFVSSRDLGGGNDQVELNHQHWIFNGSSAWFDQQNNPSYFATDSDHALSFASAAPWFFIVPGRIYSAAVWCYGDCDASGLALPTASYAVAAISARMPFLVVAQSKN